LSDPGWTWTASPPVTWDGLALNPLADDANGVLCVVEDVTGWYDSPDYDGHDTALVLSDGSLTGPKTAAARTVTINGSAVGPPPALALFRDQLVTRAARLVPADLMIPDAAGRYMTASVRCDSDGFKHTFSGPGLFAWQLTLTAADPRKYGTSYDGNLAPVSVGTGWRYAQAGDWRVGVTVPANGNAPYDWVMTMLGLVPTGGAVSHNAFCYTYNGGSATSLVLSSYVGAKLVDNGDVALLLLVADRPVKVLTVTDTQGNVYTEAYVSTAAGRQHHIWLCPNAKAMTQAAADKVTVTTDVGWVGTAQVTGFKGVVGQLMAAATSSGHSDIPNASLWLPQQTAVVLASLSGPSGLAFLTPPGGVWTPYELLGTGNLYSVGLRTGLLTAPVWPVANNVRGYKRLYGDKVLANTLVLENAGNVPAPVLLNYLGDLGTSRLVDNATGNTIYLAAVPGQAQVTVDSETLNAWAPGGVSRASYVLPGSAPLMVPATGSATWTLYSTGAGQVTAQWSAAWQ
jgi:hypothetical protein